jgi:hypothetical protein
LRSIVQHIALRIFVAVGILAFANMIYTRYLWPQDVKKYSRVKNAIDSAFLTGEIIYLGESSNTSFNPWTDTFAYSISDFLQMYLPERKVKAITHEGYHAGLFRKMLNLMPDAPKPKAVVLTLNLRTCGPAAVFSANEGSNNQEALFYSQRPPLLTRLFLSLKFYDNAPPPERERAKLQYWRTRSLDMPGKPFSYKTVRHWYENNPYAAQGVPEKIKHMADAYIKEFAFVLNESNPRVKDVDDIAAFLYSKGVPLILVLLPENRDYAQRLFGDRLTALMDYNANFLKDRYAGKDGVKLLNMYPGAGGENYTDQWYPTEHFNAKIRSSIALNIAEVLGKPAQINPVANNRPNPEVKQPMADTLLRQLGPR